MARILPDLRHRDDEKPHPAEIVPLEPPRPVDIEGRPSVGDDPLLDKLRKEHPEREP